MRKAFRWVVMVGILAGGFFSPFAKAADLITVEKAVAQMFKDAVIVKEEFCLSPIEVQRIEEQADLIFKDTHSLIVTRYTATQNGQVVGYGFEDTVQGKWGPIHYLVALGLPGDVIEVVILDYQEIRGKPIAKKRFLKQYQGKTVLQPVRLRKDIDGVTGATISSRSLTDGIRKILYIFNENKTSGALTACEKP